MSILVAVPVANFIICTIIMFFLLVLLSWWKFQQCVNGEYLLCVIIILRIFYLYVCLSVWTVIDWLTDWLIDWLTDWLTDLFIYLCKMSTIFLKFWYIVCHLGHHWSFACSVQRWKWQMDQGVIDHVSNVSPLLDRWWTNCAVACNFKCANYLQ